MTPPVFWQLYTLKGGDMHFNVLGNKPLIPQAHLVTDTLSLFERLKLHSLQLAVMEKYILTAITGDESITSLSV